MTIPRFTRRWLCWLRGHDWGGVGGVDYHRGCKRCPRQEMYFPFVLNISGRSGHWVRIDHKRERKLP